MLLTSLISAMPFMVSLLCSISIPQAGDDAPVSAISVEPPLCNVKYPPAGRFAGKARNHPSDTVTGPASALAETAASETTNAASRTRLFTLFPFVVDTQCDQNADHARKARQRAGQPDDQPAIMLIADARQYPRCGRRFDRPG